MFVTKFIEQDNARTVSGKLRPSGRFSVCQIFPKKCKGFKNGTQSVDQEAKMRTVSEIDRNYDLLIRGSDPTMLKLSEATTNTHQDIGSSIATNSHIRAQRGSRGISSRQRDVLCWSANTLERIYRQSNMSFLTLTLPELSEEDLISVKDNWSDIVNTVQTYIQRDMKNANCTTAITGCTELQLERFQNSGRSFPHLHLVFRGRFHSRSAWLIRPERFRDIWRRSVSRFLSNKSYDWNASENVQQVRKSTGGYLAKYVSKCQSKHSDGSGVLWHPSDWVICSRRLRNLYEKLTRSGYDIAQVLLEVCRTWQKGIGYKQPIIISTPAYGDRKIGEWGWLKGEEIYPTFAELHCT